MSFFHLENMTFIADSIRFPDESSVVSEIIGAFETVPGGFYNTEVCSIEPDPEMSGAWIVDVDCDHDGFTRNDEDSLRHMLHNWFGFEGSDFLLLPDYNVIAED